MKFSLIWILFPLLLANSVLGERVETIAGNRQPKNNGDHGVATQIGVKDTFGVDIGPDGALYVTEVGHHRVRRVDLASRRISTVAGNARKGYAGDEGSATNATLNEPYEVRFDKAGNMYFVEMQNHIIRKVDGRTKRITTIAGTGKSGFGGDGANAIRAQMHRPHSIALDADGNVYVADIGNHRIRRIDQVTGIIETIAGTGEKKLPLDGQVAQGNPILGPRALYIQENALWIALREGNSVWKMDLDVGTLQHIAGSGKKGYRDGHPKQATFNGPKGIVVDEHDNVFVVDTENHAIRRIDGISREVTTVLGPKPDAVKPTSEHTSMNRPHGICIDDAGLLYVGDTLNHRVIRIRP